jgi:uncharacterized protein (TIGR02646 family)
VSVAPDDVADALSRVQAASWDNWRGERKRRTIDALAQAQGYVCAYCESRLVQASPPRDKAAYHGDHIVPASCIEGEGRQFDWDNLIASCRKEFVQGEARHCGHMRGNWYDDILFVHPLNTRCESAFIFSDLGLVSAAPGVHEIAAQETIVRLNLNDQRLVNSRREALSVYNMLYLYDLPSLDELRRMRDALALTVNGQREPHLTTLLQLLDRLLVA